MDRYLALNERRIKLTAQISDALACAPPTQRASALAGFYADLVAILDEELRLAPELSLGQGLVDCIRRERTYADERAKWWTGSATAWRDAEAEVLGGAA